MATNLEIHYRHTLEELGKRSGMLGVIFRKAQNKIQDPAKLRRLIVDLIDKEQWSSPFRRREGRRLRGAAAKERRGRERRRGPILHSAPAHRRDGGRDRTAAGTRRSAIRPAARAVSCSRRMITFASITSSTERKRRSSRTARSSASSWWTASRASAR